MHIFTPGIVSVEKHVFKLTFHVHYDHSFKFKSAFGGGGGEAGCLGASRKRVKCKKIRYDVGLDFTVHSISLSNEALQNLR